MRCKPPATASRRPWRRRRPAGGPRRPRGRPGRRRRHERHGRPGSAAWGRRRPTVAFRAAMPARRPTRRTCRRGAALEAGGVGRRRLRLGPCPILIPTSTPELPHRQGRPPARSPLPPAPPADASAPAAAGPDAAAADADADPLPAGEPRRRHFPPSQHRHLTRQAAAPTVTHPRRGPRPILTVFIVRCRSVRAEAVTIQQIVRDVLERAIEDGLVSPASPEMRDEPDPRAVHRRGLAGASACSQRTCAQAGAAEREAGIGRVRVTAWFRPPLTASASPPPGPAQLA